MLQVHINIGLIALLVLNLASCGGGSSDSADEGNINRTISTPLPTAMPSPTPVPSSQPSEIAEYSIEVIEKNALSRHPCNQPPGDANSAIHFSEISADIGLGFSHLLQNGDGLFGQSGGVGAGDYDNDGWVDLYAIGGDIRPNLLLRNRGDGSFEDLAPQNGLDSLGKGSGPTFGDFNGDGRIDLFVGSVDDGTPKLFLNHGEQGFVDITESSGLAIPGNNIGATWGDYDGDQDLDLVIAHWTLEQTASTRGIWRNNGDLTFSNVSVSTNIRWRNGFDWSFAPSFADINSDGLQDILFVADGNTSAVFLNQPEGYFINIANAVISDKSGMGSAVGDYDNDGDIDWFVSSISRTEDPFQLYGNRLYRNLGNGYFEDVTEEAGVREGFWGWGACFADFTNDGHLDIFHVNGMEGRGELYQNDPSRLFIANGDGSFTEQSIELGIDDRGMGRGVVCFDYDRDGDQDIFIANHNAPAQFYCNHGNQNNYLNIQLKGRSPNTQALGARIYLTLGNTTQMRELRVGNNYVSHNPVEAHFGLATTNTIDSIKIIWPDSAESIIENLTANQSLIIERQ